MATKNTHQCEDFVLQNIIKETQQSEKIPLLQNIAQEAHQSETISPLQNITQETQQSEKIPFILQNIAQEAHQSEETYQSEKNSILQETNRS